MFVALPNCRLKFVCVLGRMKNFYLIDAFDAVGGGH